MQHLSYSKLQEPHTTVADVEWHQDGYEENPNFQQLLLQSCKILEQNFTR
jgi:hypothetical protein